MTTTGLFAVGFIFGVFTTIVLERLYRNRRDKQMVRRTLDEITKLDGNKFSKELLKTKEKPNWCLCKTHCENHVCINTPFDCSYDFRRME